MFSGEWESDGGLFAVGDFLISDCVGAWKGVRRFGVQDVSGAHWAGEVERLRSPAALPLGLRGRPSQLDSVAVFRFAGVWKRCLDAWK